MVFNSLKLTKPLIHHYFTIFEIMKMILTLCLFAGSLLPSSSLCSQNFDIDLLHSINSGNTSSWDKTNRIISQSMTPLSIAAPASFFLYGVLAHDSISKRNSFVMGAGLLASGAITIGLKYAVNRARPFNTYPFIEKKGEGGGPSFPSGHTSSAFATATSLSLCYPKWYVIAPSFLWASAMGYSRTELGVHYPSDVLAGAIIGIGSSFLMWKVNKKMGSKQKLQIK
jgi:membrane-associated phospholipid phosphatase